jgi:hypothetical protein
MCASEDEANWVSFQCSTEREREREREKEKERWGKGKEEDVYPWIYSCG